MSSYPKLLLSSTTYAKDDNTDSNTISAKEMHYFKIKLSNEIHAQLTLVNAEYLRQQSLKRQELNRR